MKFDIYDFSKNAKRKTLRVVSCLVIIVGIGSMIKGPVGSNESLFSRYDLPWWMYLITIMIVTAFAIIFLSVLFSPLRSNGYLQVEKDKLIVCRGSSIIEISSLKNFSIQYDSRYERVEQDKTNYYATVEYNEAKISFGMSLSAVEKTKLDEKIKLIVQ